MRGDWVKAAKMAASMVDQFDQAKKSTLTKIGAYMEAQLKKGMTDQAPGGQPYQELHPFTLKMRGNNGTKALINHGDLRNSITHIQVDADNLFVGVLRGENATGDGLDFANLAEIHEEGRSIQVTPKMRAWLHYNGLHLSPNTTHIVIPARPTFGPVFEAEKEHVQQIFTETMKEGMGDL